MQEIYPKIRKADGIVFASPIYWFNITAQMKLFIDRTYAIQSNGKYAFSDKDVGVVLTYADRDIFSSGGINALRSFQDIFAFVGANLVGMVYGTAEKPGDMEKNQNHIDNAFELGIQLVKHKKISK